MVMSEPKPKHVKGPVRDPQAARVCGLHHISNKQEQLVTLHQLRAALQTAIHELEREHQHEHMVNRAFMVLRFTKATCDAFIGMAATFAETFVPASAKAAKKVSALYGAGTALGEAAGTKMAGGSVNVTKTAIDLAKARASGIHDKGYELLADSMIVKAEVIHAAMNNEPKEVTIKAAGYAWDLNKKIAQIGLEHVGREKTSKAVGLFAETAKLTFEYNEALGKVFDDMLDNEEEGDQRYVSLKASLLKQAKRVSGQISALENSVGTSSTNARARLP
jgi:hypothetical protein